MDGRHCLQCFLGVEVHLPTDQSYSVVIVGGGSTGSTRRPLYKATSASPSLAATSTSHGAGAQADYVHRHRHRSREVLQEGGVAPPVPAPNAAPNVGRERDSLRAGPQGAVRKQCLDVIQGMSKVPCEQGSGSGRRRTVARQGGGVNGGGEVARQPSVNRWDLREWQQGRCALPQHTYRSRSC
jgi:hypothetical protein